MTGRRTETIASSYFDALYQADEDPWRFRTSNYEAAKYEATLAFLGRPHYRSALEVGCSIGVLTAMLAERCDGLLAIDGSAVALEAAKASCAAPGVTFEARIIPDQYPAGPFDLIVLSEVIYYLTVEDARRTAALSDAQLAPGGEMVLCHWLGETDYPLSGDEAVDAFQRGLPPGYQHVGARNDLFRLDRFSRE